MENVKLRLRDFAEFPLRLSGSDSREPPGYGHWFETTALWRLLTEKAAVSDYCQRKEIGICEKKFIYRNGEAA